MPRVALLEANRRNLELMTDALEPAGFEVLGYPDADALLASLENTVFDAALLDAAGIGIEFGNACDGLRKRGVPFIVVVAPHGPIDGERALQHGSTGILERPLTMRGLVNVLCNLSELSQTWRQSS